MQYQTAEAASDLPNQNGGSGFILAEPKRQSLSDHSKSAEKAEHTGASLGSGKSLSEPLESS